jgi:hypothetical protein
LFKNRLSLTYSILTEQYPECTVTTIWNPQENSIPQRFIPGARRSGVDRHVCNVKATGSNPVESIRFHRLKKINRSSRAVPGVFGSLPAFLIFLSRFLPQ